MPVLRNVAEVLHSEGSRLGEIASKQGAQGFAIAGSLDEAEIELSNAEVFGARSNGIFRGFQDTLAVYGEEIVRLETTVASTFTAMVEARKLLRQLDAMAAEFGAMAFETKLISKHLIVRSGMETSTQSETADLCSSMENMAERCAATVKDVRRLVKEVLGKVENATRLNR